MEQQNLSTRESIYEALRSRITQFDLLPGDTLSENTLAAELGTSRTPVRDALARLADENYIVVAPQRETAVSRISVARVRQAVFLRTALEQSVLEELCRTGLSPSQIALLEESLHLQHAHYDAQQDALLLDEDTRMHRLLYRFCGHESAWSAFNAINCDLMRVRFLQIRTFNYKSEMSAVESWQNQLIEHRMIFDALRKCDSQAACLLSSTHIGQILHSAENLRVIYPQYFAESGS